MRPAGAQCTPGGLPEEAEELLDRRPRLAWAAEAGGACDPFRGGGGGGGGGGSSLRQPTNLPSSHQIVQKKKQGKEEKTS